MVKNCNKYLFTKYKNIDKHIVNNINRWKIRADK